MSNSEDALRFFEWPQLERNPPGCSSPTVSSTISTPIGGSPHLSQSFPPNPGPPSMLVSTEGLDHSDNAPQFSPRFNLSKLKDDPPILSSRWTDENAGRILGAILNDIEAGLNPNSSAVEALVVYHQGQFVCPFAGCLKKDGGWACIRNASYHIWIDHLFRRIPCPWNGCAVTFGREQEMKTHIDNKHMGNEKKVICSECGKVVTTKNLRRHLIDIHKVSITQVQRTVDNPGHPIV